MLIFWLVFFISLSFRLTTNSISLLVSDRLYSSKISSGLYSRCRMSFLLSSSAIPPSDSSNGGFISRLRVSFMSGYSVFFRCNVLSERRSFFTALMFPAFFASSVSFIFSSTPSIVILQHGLDSLPPISSTGTTLFNSIAFLASFIENPWQSCGAS